MNKPPKKKTARLFSSEYAGLWRILLPAAAAACCVILLIPLISALTEYAKADNPLSAAVTPDKTAVGEHGDAACTLRLTASSVERDMSVVVRDENNRVVTGERFFLTVTSPDGSSADYVTNTEGSCYIVELSPGEYTVSMSGTAGYSSPEAIKCTVREQSEYAPIQNISQIIDVVDAGEISLSEVKAQPAPEEQALVVPELIISSPVTDSLGHPVYSYTVNLGPNGYILYRGTEQESDVLPVDENGDGIPEYGRRYESEQPPANNGGERIKAPAENGSYISVALYNADNTPVELYSVDAVPLTKPADTGSDAGGWKKENGHTYYYGTDGERAVGLKKIDGRLCYFNSRGEKASSLGIDVSCFNGHINWKAVREQGITFAIMRVGGRGWMSGRIYEDTFLQENLLGAKNAGIKTGVYFYSTAVNTTEAVQEASVVIDKLKGAHLDYPVFIDMEFSGSFPRGRADRLATAVRVDIANAFCRTVIAGGYTAGIYASEYYMTSAMDYRALAQYSYWLANYTEGNAMPKFSGRYDLWQFTNAGQVSGISGTVDMNAVF